MTQNLRSFLPAILAVVSLASLAGCSHRSRATATPPPPPAMTPAPVGPPAANPTPSLSPNPVASSSEDEAYVLDHRPIYSEEGVASWYGPPYHNRRGANGQIYDEHQLSAANRTLPMGSLIKVTNLRTGQSAVMRVTDRGPFVPGRILDLSLAAAKQVGVYLPGTAQVRIDVYDTPRPMDTGGRWAVQIGAFRHKSEALRLEEHLERKYTTANVIEFTGPTGDWVRIRPANDNRELAEQLAQEIRPAEGEAYLVRLD